MKPVRILAVVAVIIATVTGVAAVSAFFSARGAGIANASDGTLNAPTSVTVTNTPGSGTISVSWTASAVSGDAAAPDGYYVLRHNLSGVPIPTCSTSAFALTTATSCHDLQIADGTWYYSVVAVYRSWSSESAQSANVTVVNDTTPPTTTITVPTNGATYNAAAWSHLCSSGTVTGVCGAAGDPAGVAGVKVAIANSEGSYWNGSSFGGTTPIFNPATGTTSWSYAFAPPVDNTYTVYVQATDGDGNTTASGFETHTSFTYDTSAPTTTVTPIQNSPTNTQPLTYAIVFSEPVTDLAVGGVTVGGTANRTAATVTVSKIDSSNFTVSVSGLKTDGTGDGTVTVQVSAGAVTDLAGNPNAISNTASVTWDRTAPHVASINITGPQNTNASSLPWTVTFSEPVNTSQVVPGAFLVSTGGVSGTPPSISSITPISPSGGFATSYTFVVSTVGATGANNGSIRLDLSTHPGTIQDQAGNNINATFNYPFMNYLFDTTPPTVNASVPLSGAANPTNAETLSFTFFFQEPVPVSAVTASHFTIATTNIGGPAPTIATITPVTPRSGFTAQYTVTVNMNGDLGANNGTVELDLTDLTGIVDVAGNAMTSGTPATLRTYTYDTTAPTVTVVAAKASANTQPLTYSAVFSEPVGTLAAAGVSLTAPAADAGAAVSVTKTDSQHYTISVSGLPANGSGDGTISANVKAGAVSDTAGNPNTVSNTASTIWDTTPPTAGVTAAMTTTNSQPVAFAIVFSEPVSNLGTTGVNLSVPAADTGVTVSIVKTDSEHFTIGVSGLRTDGSGDGAITASIKAGAVTDAAGNGNTASGAASTTWDTTAPTVTLSQAATQADPAATSPIHFTAVFSEPVTGLTSAGVTLSGTAGLGSATVIVTAVDSEHYDIAVDGISSDGTVSAALAAGVTTDPAGNPNAASTAGADDTVTLDTSGT